MAPTDYHIRLLTDNFAPILTSFSRSVVSDQCSTSFGKARVRFWLLADTLTAIEKGLLLTQSGHSLDGWESLGVFNGPLAVGT